MSKRVVVLLVVSVFLLAAGTWKRRTYRRVRTIDFATLLKVIDEQPQSIAPGSIRTWGAIYGEIQDGVLPSEGAAVLGVANPDRIHDRFFVVGMSEQQRGQAIDALRKSGFPPNNRNPNNRLAMERGIYRSLLVLGLYGLAAALLLLFEDRRQKAMAAADAEREEDRVWWCHWRGRMTLATGLLVLALCVFWIGLGASVWYMIVPALLAPALAVSGALLMAGGLRAAFARRRLRAALS